MVPFTTNSCIYFACFPRSKTFYYRYDANPSCSYSDGELNFAIHVRMGDRRLITGTNDDYFGMLEALMDSITESVLTRRSTPPKFHVFTETLLPCPSGETGAFGEFASWPVELRQVRRKSWSDFTNQKRKINSQYVSRGTPTANKLHIHIP